MTRLIAALFLFSTVAVGSASAQPFTPNGEGVTMGHWHLNSRDVEAQKKMFVGMGGAAAPQVTSARRVSRCRRDPESAARRRRRRPPAPTARW